MSIIEVKHLTKKYDQHLAVNDISFSVEEGELFALLGENGAGKSTTIHILCTILEKSQGDVCICGYFLGREDDEIRKNIGIVFQNSVLDPKLTVQENLMTRGSFYGMKKVEIQRRLAEFETYFEMQSLWKKPYGTLSGGQKRRVDICRSLIHDPRILFLDEPTTGLDPKNRKLVWEYIHFLRKEKKMTIFLTTHYMEETSHADHVVILDQGKIMCQDTPSRLKDRFAPAHFLWYTQPSHEAEIIVSKMGDPQYEQDHYVVNIHGNITAFLYAYRHQIVDYEIIKGSMDDVFLNCTGHSLE